MQKQIVGGAVTAVWVACALASLITSDPVPVTIVTPPMMLYLGYLFGIKVVTRNGKNGASNGS